METLRTSHNDSTDWPNDDQNISFIINCIEIPFICFAFYSLTNSTQAVRFVAINLLIADLIQTVCMLLMHIDSESILNLSVPTYAWVAITALHFRMCMAIERYSHIACPGPSCPVIRLVHTILSGWLLPLIVLTPFYILHLHLHFYNICIKVLVYVIPFISHVVVILCFVGACWSLFHSTSLTPTKKCFALAPNVLMLISYIILTLPFQIMLIIIVKTFAYQNGQFIENGHEFTLFMVFFILYMFNPLVDCLLCVFMRSDAENTRTPHCFSRLKRNQRETGDVSYADGQPDHV